jgi:hypothetical protein
MFNDLDFLKNWGLEGRDVCCLKVPHGDYYEFGFLMRGNPLAVNLGNPWDGGNGQVQEYDSFEAMVADGWMVD